MNRLWLCPKDQQDSIPLGWVAATSLAAAKAHVITHGWLPEISFNHDLDNAGGGLAFARWLISQGMAGMPHPIGFRFIHNGDNSFGALMISLCVESYLDLRRDYPSSIVA